LGDNGSKKQAGWSRPEGHGDIGNKKAEKSKSGQRKPQERKKGPVSVNKHQERRSEGKPDKGMACKQRIGEYGLNLVFTNASREVQKTARSRYVEGELGELENRKQLM